MKELDAENSKIRRMNRKITFDSWPFERMVDIEPEAGEDENSEDSRSWVKYSDYQQLRDDYDELLSKHMRLLDCLHSQVSYRREQCVIGENDV